MASRQFYQFSEVKLYVYVWIMSATNITMQGEKDDDKDKPCGNLYVVKLNLDSHLAWGSVNQGCRYFPKI